MANDLVEEDFEAGTNTNDVTTSNSTATSIDGTAASTAMKFTNSPVAEGSLAMALTTSANYRRMIWDFTAQTDAWFVFRFRFTAAPAAITYLVSFTTQAGATLSDVRINTDRTLAIRNGTSIGSGFGAQTTTALSVDTWYRIAIHIVPNTTNGLTIKVYEGESATPLETVSGNSNINQNVDRVKIGYISAATFTAYFDLIEASSTEEPSSTAPDTTDPVASVNLVSTVATYDGVGDLTDVDFNVTAAGSTDNVGVTGYSWSDGGAGGTFSSTTVAAPTWTPPDFDGPWTLTCTVSDAAANTDSAGVVVDIPSSGGGSSPVSGVAYAAAGAAI